MEQKTIIRTIGKNDNKMTQMVEAFRYNKTMVERMGKMAKNKYYINFFGNIISGYHMEKFKELNMVITGINFDGANNQMWVFLTPL